VSPWWLLPLCAGLLIALLAWQRQVRTMRTSLRAKDDELYRLGRSLTDSKLQGLRMQLDPHFLFNRLNGLSVLIDKEGEYAGWVSSAACMIVT
jgi:sensor histidine kinase YesM